MTALIISNEKMSGIMKIGKSFKESGLPKQLKIKQKNKKADLLLCYWVH